jgi:hypothetical protein
MTNMIIYLIGTLLVVAGLAYGASRLGVSQVWIVAGALVIVTTGGLPIGLQISGPNGGEAQVLQLAAAYGARLIGTGKRPACPRPDRTLVWG